VTDESKKKGFGGLSSLVSGVDEEESPKKPTSLPAKAEPERTSATASDGATTQTAAPKPKSPSPPRTVHQTQPPQPKGSSAAKWFWSIVGIGILVALFNAGQEDRSSSGSRTTYSPPSSSSAPSTYTSPKPIPSPEFSKPPVGTNKVLSVAQIRWCLREDIRNETRRSYINTNFEVNRFNKMVTDYNKRCGTFRYKIGSLKRAKRDIRGMRLQIVNEASMEFNNSSSPPIAKSSSPSIASRSSIEIQNSGGTTTRNRKETAKRSTYNKDKKSTNSMGYIEPSRYRANNQDLELASDIQKRLQELGYSPGPIDGIAGRKTRAAIRRFQNNIGLLETGEISGDLLQVLINSENNNRTDITVKTKPEYFTEGSTKVELLQIQGKPDSKNTSSHYVEKWLYGISTVTISKKSGRVVSWSNNGGLKAKRSTLNPRDKERIDGKWASKVEELAIKEGCSPDGGSDLLSTQGITEYYRVFCSNQSTLRITCKRGFCTAYH